MEDRKPRWRTSSFLLYAGAFVVLLAASWALTYLAIEYDDGAFVGWSALVLAVLAGVAEAFRRRRRWIAAGVFSFAAVVVWGTFLGALWTWAGWLDATPTPGALSAGGSSFAHFSFARLSLELLVVLAATWARRRFAFPLPTLISAVVGWFFVIDLVSSGGTWTAVVTLLVGLLYLGWGSASDNPSAFWLHLVAGALVGGSVLYWLHSGDWQWALVAVLALVYVRVARSTGRSSWAVWAVVGLLLASGHFAAEWTGGTGLPVLGGQAPASPKPWVPAVVLAFTGFLIVALGLASAGRRRTS